MLGRRRRTGGREADAHARGSPAGGGRPRLVGAHPSRRASHRCRYSCGALLLARIRPGTPLPGGHDPVSAAVAGLLARLHLAAPGELPFPALEDIYPRLENQARRDADFEQRTRGDPARGAAGLERLEMARAAAMKLCATTERAVLLHGDFLTRTCCGPAPATWPSIRSRASATRARDAGFFAACHPPATTILPRAGAVAGHMGLDRQRARRWAAVWAVLQTCQAWREDQSDLEACLYSDQFKHLLALSNASSQILTAAMLILPGRGKARPPPSTSTR